MDDPGPLSLFEYPLSTSWTAIIISLCTCAFFSGIEIAFISANKLRIELRSKQGHFTARILSYYVKNPSAFISTTLVANNIGLVVYGIFMGDVLNGMLIQYISEKFLRYVVITILSTGFVLVTAEFLPKSLFRLNPDMILSALAVPFQLFYYLLWPLVYAVVVLSKALIRLFGAGNLAENSPVFNRIDLDQYISQVNEKHLEEEADVDAEMFRNALDFGSLRVRDCMIPRTEIVAVEENESIENIRALFADSAHSKVLVYRGNMDQIIGYVHQSDMFNHPTAIRNILIPIIIVSDATTSLDLLKELIRKQKSIAAVVDEFGGTAGIVTIEDVMEEIFGEIEDEHDVEDLKEVYVNEGHYIFSTRLEIYYLNEKYGLNIPEGEYSTLSGYIISLCESIPKTRDIVEGNGLKFIITKVRGARIDEVELFSNANSPGF